MKEHRRILGLEPVIFRRWYSIKSTENGTAIDSETIIDDESKGLMTAQRNHKPPLRLIHQESESQCNLKNNLISSSRLNLESFTNICKSYTYTNKT